MSLPANRTPSIGRRGPGSACPALPSIFYQPNSCEFRRKRISTRRYSSHMIRSHQHGAGPRPPCLRPQMVRPSMSHRSLLGVIMKHVVLTLFTLGLLNLNLSAASPPLANIALDAPAYANAPLYNNVFPALMVNGDKSAAGNQVFHGLASIAPGYAYWIDLGAQHAISEIKIYPRQDGCCPERLSNFHVALYENM